MKQQVRLLDELTANQIAAGEVIERPLSVVKELVENALDAGATRINVDLRAGGLDYLRVTDNGYGMAENELLLAVKRHATSKLRTIEDLNSLTTLGFRGEALPSIISVARVEIVSRESGQELATRAGLEGGDLVGIEKTGAPEGTSVTVTDLFFNTPARKKFMRTAGYEAGLIHELMTQFALSHPQIGFRLFHEGKELLNTAGINQLSHLLQHFYGQEIGKALTKLDKVLAHGRLTGFLTTPGYSRANRKGIHFIINRRRVFSGELLAVLEQAYESLLPKGRFPAAVINLELDPALLDVNTHPAKLEIRFRSQEIVREAGALIREALDEAHSVPSYPLPQTSSLPPFKPSTVQETRVQETWQEFYSWNPKGRPAPQDIVKPAEPEYPADLGLLTEETAEEVVSPGEKKELPTPVEAEKSTIPELKIIGQFNNTFILAEGAEGLYIIDQHVAHERVIYERLREQAKEGRLAGQVLLAPVPLQLTPLEEELLIEHILPLHDLGLILEHFGPRSYLLRSVPACIKGNPLDFLESLLHNLESRAGKLLPAEIRKDFLITASCKGAVKAGQKLTLQEMEQLMHDLQQTQNPLTCPHGRPILYHISHNHLLKAFRRI